MDIGAFALSHPPNTPFFVPTGVQYALETYRGGFLVTDGHHNRVLQVTLDGEVSEFRTFGNIVPTGLEVWGNTVYMAETVVTLGGEIWKIDDVSRPPFGVSR